MGTSFRLRRGVVATLGLLTLTASAPLRSAGPIGLASHAPELATGTSVTRVRQGKSGAALVSGTKPPGAAVLVNGRLVVPATGQAEWEITLPKGPRRELVVESRTAVSGTKAGSDRGGPTDRKPVIAELTVEPPIVAAGQPATVTYALRGRSLSDPAELESRVEVFDGDRLVQTIFAGRQPCSERGVRHTLEWKAETTTERDRNRWLRLRVSTGAPGSSSDETRANPVDQTVAIVDRPPVALLQGKLHCLVGDTTISAESSPTLPVEATKALVRQRIRAVAALAVAMAPGAGASVPVRYELAGARGPAAPYLWDTGRAAWRPIPARWDRGRSAAFFEVSQAGLLVLGSSGI